MSQELENAFAFSSVLSLPFVLERIVPLIAEALGTEAAAPTPSS